MPSSTRLECCCCCAMKIVLISPNTLLLLLDASTQQLRMGFFEVKNESRGVNESRLSLFAVLRRRYRCYCHTHTHTTVAVLYYYSSNMPILLWCYVRFGSFIFARQKWIYAIGFGGEVKGKRKSLPMCETKIILRISCHDHWSPRQHNHLLISLSDSGASIGWPNQLESIQWSSSNHSNKW